MPTLVPDTVSAIVAFGVIFGSAHAAIDDMAFFRCDAEENF